MEQYIRCRNDQKHRKFTCNSEWECDIMNACKDLYLVNMRYGGIENMDPAGIRYKCQHKIEKNLTRMIKENRNPTNSPEMVEYVLRRYPALLAELVEDYQKTYQK